MPSTVERLREDIETALAKDPAAKSALEIIVAYPGVHALWAHRLSHTCWNRGFRLLARVLSHLTRFLTGVEIHPGADIGRRCFIDHGAGVVVGETTAIGDDVMLYQGVTLGGDTLADEKRHPTLEDGATVGANATLLGPIAIGENASVGAGSVVLESVPPNCTVVGNPAKLVGECLDEDGVERGNEFAE
jgi:serine O-acetyltransferase